MKTILFLMVLVSGTLLAAKKPKKVTVLNGLSKDVINAVIIQHRAELRACYNSAKERVPNLKGKMGMDFTIQPTGIVSSAKVRESTVNDPGLESCFEKRIKTWTFPKPSKPVVTEMRNFPFYFHPEK